MPLVPAISGADTKTFDDMFWKGITEKQLLNRRTVPTKGSIGVFWHLYKDLRVLGSDNIAKQKVNKLYPRNPEEGKLMTAVNSKALKAFYEWTQQKDPLFFIKKGTQPLWLCKKVGSYYYEDRADDPYWYPHRIAFEFIRQASETEGVKRMGVGMNTMIWIELDETLPKPIVSIEAVEMPPKKKAEAKRPTEAKKPGRKSKTKTTATVETVVEPIPVITNATIVATHVESEEDPLEVEVIKVQAFEIDGTDYFREPIKNKIYKRMGGGGVGPYIGRWSPRDLMLHEEMPDSDREDDI